LCDMKNRINAEIRSLLDNTQRISIISHIRTDGDAVGSLLGLGLSLLATGKEVQMIVADGVPANFRHLHGSDLIVQKITHQDSLSIVVDCSDLARTGNSLNGKPPDINIDHHITNLNFATINFVDPQATATSELIAKNLERWGLPISVDIAECLLFGIISDTLGFRTSNMTPECLRQAARLMDYGANLAELYKTALLVRSFEAVRFWGQGLTRLQYEDRIVWTTLTQDDRKEVSYPGNDDADLVNILTTIESCDIAIIFVEQKNGNIKVSWRSQPGIDVSQLAFDFGGGGHPAASGAEIKGSLEEVQKQVFEATRFFLNAIKLI